MDAKIYAITDVNQDGKTDFSDFFIILKSIMKKQEKITQEGILKRRNTLNTIKSMLGLSTYQRYEPLIECALEFIHSTFFIKKCLKCF